MANHECQMAIERGQFTIDSAVVIWILSLRRATSRLLIKDSDRTVIRSLCVLVRIANSSQPCSPQLAQGAHHVKHHACLAGLIEMQVMPNDNVKQVVRSKSPIARRLDVVAGYEEFLLTIRSCEDAYLGIIGAVSEKLQGQKRMSGAAFSQVNLNRVRLPFSVLRAHHYKIQGEATDNTFFGQTFAYLGSFACNEAGIGCVGRENAAEIALSGWPAQKLVMR